MKSGRIFNVRYGGLSKSSLIALLRENEICLNRYAEMLLESENFPVSEKPAEIRIAELSVGELGLQDGVTLSEIIKKAEEQGLRPCSAEVGPYLRLAYKDQPEEHEKRSHCAPKGSLTLISKPLSTDEEFPRGFYLRKIDGKLWLRGYVCPEDHGWSREDRVGFEMS